MVSQNGNSKGEIDAGLNGMRQGQIEELIDSDLVMCVCGTQLAQ
jgi:hypothetical protein